ncbi:hypothetical protein AU467_23555 [Mesorhizobium loti]|uniref:PRTase-CE domain-containing protein n=1 Tax=Rhizobium loti TaxID=381 RepID=A0A101KRZ2_RHILI|nr:hypothetical protein AU467_23555 [Mesorhizobium loti]
MIDEVRAAVATEVSSFEVNSFGHLWMDGIHKPNPEREPDIIRRSRTLVAVARAARRGKPVTLENVIANANGIRLLDNEVAPVLNDFVRREVLLSRDDGSYDFKLPIFKAWLKEVGVNRLVSDALGEELAVGILAAEDAAYIRAEEIIALVKRWPVYRGHAVSAEAVRAWLEQVESHQDQRLLFKILESLRFFGEAQIREMFATLHSFIRPSLPEFVQRKRAERRMDVLVTYVDGEGKSGQYHAAKYAEHNGIPVKCIIPPSVFTESLSTHVQTWGSPAVLVMIDDIVATGRSLARNVKKFVEKNEQALRLNKLPITVLTLASTGDGDQFVREQVAEFDWLDFNIRHCETLDAKHFAFDERNEIWANQIERDRAKSLCRDLGVGIYPDNPLGFGDQGMLVAFPTTCPNNSLPILHSAGRQNNWKPLFERVTN